MKKLLIVGLIVAGGLLPTLATSMMLKTSTVAETVPIGGFVIYKVAETMPVGGFGAFYVASTLPIGTDTVKYWG